MFESKQSINALNRVWFEVFIGINGIFRVLNDNNGVYFRQNIVFHYIWHYFIYNKCKY